MTRAAICGSPALAAAAEALGLDPASGGRPDLVLLELSDDAALAAAAAIPADVPRVVVASEEQRELVRALGLDASRVAVSADPVALGPLVREAAPVRRGATRLIAVTSARGGVGRTLLAANLAARLAKRGSTWLLDVTGSGAAGWWLRAEPRPWSEMEGLAGELAPEQLRVVAAEVAPGIRLIGGAPVAPSTTLLRALVAAARSLDELVIVDAPPLADERSRELAQVADRVLVVSYEDSASAAALASVDLAESWWLIASQSGAPAIGGRDVFRSLPRDERAVGEAINGRVPIGGALGRAYDELAELLAIDAS